MFFLARRWLQRAISKMGDRGYDRSRGVRTGGLVETAQMTDVNSPRLSRGMRYEPTRARPFRRLLSTLDVPRSGAFVDVGCGRGRVLIMAAHAGFRKVVGVEYSPALCRQARENVAPLAALPGSAPITIVECDAARYVFEPDQNVIYMYNPFDASVMSEVLERIEDSLSQTPRGMWLIYQHPEARGAIESRATFSLVQQVWYGGNEFAVYRNH